MEKPVALNCRGNISGMAANAVALLMAVNADNTVVTTIRATSEGYATRYMNSGTTDTTIAARGQSMTGLRPTLSESQPPMSEKMTVEMPTVHVAAIPMVGVSLSVVTA